MDILLGILLYLAIFAAKLIEVSLATVRSVLINRGEKLLGAAIAFIEVLIWIIVISNVLSTLTEDLLKVAIYCLAYSCGNYLGVIIENRLAIGTACIQAVIPEDKKDELSAVLRERGFGVTVVQGQGRERIVDVFIIYLKRRCTPEAVGLIHSYCPSSMVTVYDVRQLRNGFIRK